MKNILFSLSPSIIKYILLGLAVLFLIWIDIGKVQRAYRWVKSTHWQDWVNPIKWWRVIYSSFLRLLFPLHKLEQMIMRVYEPNCAPCVKAGKCIGCGCSTLGKMYTPAEKCFYGWWLPMKSKKKWAAYKEEFPIKISVEYVKEKQKKLIDATQRKFDLIEVATQYCGVLREKIGMRYDVFPLHEEFVADESGVDKFVLFLRDFYHFSHKKLYCELRFNEGSESQVTYKIEDLASGRSYAASIYKGVLPFLADPEVADILKGMTADPNAKQTSSTTGRSMPQQVEDPVINPKANMSTKKYFKSNHVEVKKILKQGETVKVVWDIATKKDLTGVYKDCELVDSDYYKYAHPGCHCTIAPKWDKKTFSVDFTDVTKDSEFGDKKVITGTKNVYLFMDDGEPIWIPNPRDPNDRKSDRINFDTKEYVTLTFGFSVLKS